MSRLSKRLHRLREDRQSLLNENLSLQAITGAGGDEGVDIDAIERRLEPILGCEVVIEDGLIGLRDARGMQIIALKPSGPIGLKRLVKGEPERTYTAIEAAMDAAEWAQPLINAVRAARLKATHYANGMHIMSDAAEHAREQTEIANQEITRLRLLLQMNTPAPRGSEER